jgi:hypothetical protein
MVLHLRPCICCPHTLLLLPASLILLLWNQGVFLLLFTQVVKQWHKVDPAALMRGGGRSVRMILIR